MIMNDAAIVIITSLANLLLGLLILTRNPTGIINRIFAGLSCSLIFWTIFNFLSDQAETNNLLYTRLTFAGGIFIALSLVALSNYFPNGKSVNSIRVRKAQWIFTAIVLVLSMTPLLIPSVTKTPNGVELETGPLYLIYVIYILNMLALITRNFIVRLKNSTKVEKAQIKFLLTGILLYTVLAISSNLIIPVLVDSWSSSRVGPIFTLLFVAITAYAIAKHGLLNIKRAVVRSVAYLLSLGFIGLVYGTIIFGVSSLLDNNDHFNNAERIFYIIMALISAVLFSPTKRFFDKVTNRIFYRDSYDPQQFLDELNSTVVENIELGILLRHSTRVIQDNVKSQFCFVQVKGTSDAKQRLIGTGELNISSRDSKVLKEELVKTGKKTVITDDLNPNMSTLKEVMSRNNIGLLIRMMPGSDMSQEALYYLIVGDKKSGNIYDKQDVKLMEIIADELLIAIQNSLRFEEIQQFNVTLQQKVNDATEKLQRINKKLRDMDETKDEFISMASHQLRTPLTSVKGYLSMVLEGDAGKLKGNQEELLNQAFVSSQRMVYLIADLLNVSRLKTGKFIIEAAPTNLAEVIESEIAQLKEVAKGKKVALTFKKPEKFPKLMLDETKIRQVIMNFADNAIYYTPSGGQIKIELYEDKTNVYFTVKDDGIGIPQSEQARLFSKFYRASNARKARPDGTGLGLFMAKKVVNAQGGDVLFESKEGKGSTFGFTFKKSKLLPKETAAGSLTS